MRITRGDIQESLRRDRTFTRWNGKLFMDAINLLLTSASDGGKLPALPPNAPVYHVLAYKLVSEAISCSNPEIALKYIREILDRTVGKPKQETEVKVDMGLAARLEAAERAKKALLIESTVTPVITPETDLEAETDE